MTRPATFSISVPVGAYHPLLPACLASLAIQRSYCNVSLLDASGDPRVAALADRYKDLLFYRRHGPDKGQTDAIVEGWRNAPGELLGWLNADDFLYPNALAAACEAFERSPDLSVVSGHSAICDEQGRMTGYHWAVQPAGESLRTGCVISQPSCFFKRSACDAVGGLDASLHYTMDWDLWLRLLEDGAKFGFIDEPLSAVFWGDGTKTASFGPGRRRELERLISRHAPARSRFRARRGFALRAALDKIPSSDLRRLIERGLRRSTPFVFGVGPNGALKARARIVWMHYDDQPRNLLRVIVAGRDGASCEAPEANAVAQDGEGFLVRFDEGVEPGRAVELFLDCGARLGARLVSCGWE